MVKVFFLFFGMFFLRPASSTAAPQRLSLIFEPPSKEVYIGQEIFFQIKLIDRIGVKEIEAIPAEWPNADVFLLGKSSGKTVFDGISYNINELRFSLVAKSVGKMFFPSICLLVSVPTLMSVRDLPDNIKVLSGGKIEICAPPFTLDVKALPSYSRPLFAAAEVKLFEGVVPKASSVKEGMPVKRSVLLSAKGTLPAFLPDFQMGEVKNSRIYPGKTERTSPPAKNGVEAALRQTVVFVPHQAGKFVLPEIKVPWLNTQRGKIDTAVIPAYALTVLPASKEGKKEKEISVQPLEKNVQVKEKGAVKTVGFFVVAFFACGILIFGLFSLFRKHVGRKKLIKAVEETCLKNDFEQTAAAILVWAKTTFPNRSFFNLSDVRLLFQDKSEEFVQRLGELEMHLYGTGRFAKHVPSVSKNLSKGLLSAFLKAVRIRFEKSEKRKAKLPELYPNDNGV